MTQAVRSLRQSAVVAHSAAKSACTAAGKSNPERLLRLWTAEMAAKRTAAMVSAANVKGKSK